MAAPCGLKGARGHLFGRCLLGLILAAASVLPRGKVFMLTRCLLVGGPIVFLEKRGKDFLVDIAPTL